MFRGDWRELAFVVGGGLAIWLYLLALYGREPRVPGRQEPVTSPPQDWHPNQVYALWAWGQEVSAVLAVFNLVQRGILEVVIECPCEEGRPAPRRPRDYSVIRHAGGGGADSPSDRWMLRTLLFHGANGERVSLRQVRQDAKSDRYDAEDRLNAWRRAALAEFAPPELVEPPSWALRSHSVAIGLALVTYSVMTFSASDTAFLPLLVGLTVGIASFLVRRHTPKGALAFRQWREFGRYLSRFADWKYVSPAVDDCERYLAYALALGVEREAQRQFLRLHGDSEGTGTAFRNWRFADGSAVRNVRTAVAVMDGFGYALHSVWLMHMVPRSSG